MTSQKEETVQPRYLAYGTLWQLRTVCRFVVKQVQKDATQEELGLVKDCKAVLRRLSND